ncbi:hypothetical protein MTR_4g005850 [Medicago truncatula]|uniref:Uncharacterized protein n=1 Tax=Medicago truncatula TaxID=3880 RepID=G7JVJ7_MEDTR|nr:hypothetical protein MTR_4g005850 [Medicago truncatula]
MRWSDNVFISGGNPHLTSRFCEVVLSSTTISNLVSELVEFKGHLLLHAPSPKNVGREGVYKEKPKSHID